MVGITVGLPQCPKCGSEWIAHGEGEYLGNKGI